MAIAHRYTRPDQYYICSDEDYGYPPYNSTPDALPPRPWKNQWPQYVDNTGWVLVEDHRQRAEPHFAAVDVQPGTEYWLPEDTHDSPARRMHTPGPLPKDSLTKRPAKTDAELLAEAKVTKTAEIAAGYDAAVAASLTMPTASPTAQDVTISAAAFAAEDAEGLAYVMQTHATHRDELLAAVAAATTVVAVQDLVVSYAV
ncbi:phage tail protein [Desulfovibrio desulfuricans]|uniref:phage tail protein n=1 Tax=Desulfovibrio desulfuricans TaxID=876 RepID=UPI00398434E3